jgi:hypothetical protein
MDDRGRPRTASVPRVRVPAVSHTESVKRLAAGRSARTPARRRELLSWAARHDAAIIEDDYDSEFRHVDRPLEPIHRLDDSGRVIYVGSFSKVLSPELRLGVRPSRDSSSDSGRSRSPGSRRHWTGSGTRSAICELGLVDLTVPGPRRRSIASVAWPDRPADPRLSQALTRPGGSFDEQS